MTTVANILDELTHEGELYETLEDGSVRCFACGHRCLIREGKRGICQVRFNEGGKLRVPWGYVAALQSDPVEKKPFFHVLPGSNALTFGMLGCDFPLWILPELADVAGDARPKFGRFGQLYPAYTTGTNGANCARDRFFSRGFFLQRAADHQRVGRGDFQEGQSCRVDVRLCFERQQYARSDGISSPVHQRLQGRFEVYAG